MSPQSALSAKATTETKCNMYSDCSSLSNSQIAQAADEAFSHHKRLDLGYSNSNDDGHYNVTASNPLDDTTSSPPSAKRLQLRKRKKSFESVRFLDHGVTSYNTDFVSGIFRDLSQAEENHDYSNDETHGAADDAKDSVQFQNHEGNEGANHRTLDFRYEMSCISDDESLLSRKKLKTSGNSLSTLAKRSQSRGSLGYNKKSYSCLRSISNASSREPSLTTAASSSPRTSCTEDVSYQVSPVGRRVSVKSQPGPFISTASSDATLDTATINNLVDKVLIESLVFPTLPPTVSESSCSSNNLTQTSVQAAQVTETTPHNQQLSNCCKTHIEGEMHDNKDTYGWFVDMDLQEDEDRADVILAAQESVRAGSGADDSLSFQAFTAPKKTTELDEEVEWAKAADTVDDVLGDFF